MICRPKIFTPLYFFITWQNKNLKPWTLYFCRYKRGRELIFKRSLTKIDSMVVWKLLAEEEIKSHAGRTE
jgi:hypothetical protein